MFRTFIRYIRNQPKVVRNQFALAFSTVFTGLVVMIWLFTNTHAENGSELAAKASENNENGIFSSLFKQIGAQFASVQGGLEELKDELATSTASQEPDPRELILSPENKEMVQAEQAGRSEATSGTASAQSDMPAPTASTQYQEVQIVTTSSASTGSTSTLPR